MLFHVYTTGRFGPEKHIGIVVADNASCIQESTYVTFDIVKSTVIPKDFWTNPLAICNVNKYRRWKKSQIRRRNDVYLQA